MMHASSKMLGVHSFLYELGFLVQGVMPMYWDDQSDGYYVAWKPITLSSFVYIH